jgi:hypothetical protein
MYGNNAIHYSNDMNLYCMSYMYSILNDNTASTAVMTGLENQQPRNCGLIPNRWGFFFSSPKWPDWLWGIFSLIFSGNSELLLEAKWQQREADHLTPPGATVMNEWCYISTISSAA